MAGSAAHASKRAESRPAGRVPYSRAVALRANSLFDTMRRFRRIVWRHYRVYGRHDLPWRKNHDPYRVLVSEIMLQQTQVERVIPFYTNFLKKFPTVRALSHAPLSGVLTSWQGLGYNRRAKMLHQAAQDIVGRFDGKFPESIEDIGSLPGVGPYTARAVAAFAFNRDVIVLETNIRTAIIHHFFPNRKKISDREIENMLVRVLPKGRAREWYSALMDYGAHLKRSGISHNTRSRSYAKQPKFVGSVREVRGAIVRLLAGGAAPYGSISSLFTASRRTQVRRALAALVKEGFVKEEKGRYELMH